VISDFSPEPFRATAGATGEPIDPLFQSATLDDVKAACAAAAGAFDLYRAAMAKRRAAFLDAIADEIMELGDALIERASLESGLPIARLTGERGRTVGQIRMFAEVVRAGTADRVAHDPALPDRQPLPRPDMRRRMIPVGPVAVFGASNFPLAFSTAGGDTAAALAAGCPVVVKGHPAHPGTGELVAGAILRAARATGMPDGVFAHLAGLGNALGAALVADPHITAVGFTGSRSGGLALLRIAQGRPVPIPVYAEMSSINPVLLLPAALAARGAALGTAFVGSLTMGGGQFCTNPGLLLAIEGEGLEQFLAGASDAIAADDPALMLTPHIHSAYEGAVEALAGRQDVGKVASGPIGDGRGRAQARLFSVNADRFMADAALGHEMFGAAAIVVRCRDATQLHAVIEGLEGQLTATLQIDAGDLPLARDLLPLLERKAGRILANGWPTGVEVAETMVHGGPFPATSDPRSTSVGTLAIERFLRPVCYQNFAPELLPEALRDLPLPQEKDS
jgi:2,5-dioxopentanoate dehydrogenase